MKQVWAFLLILVGISRQFLALSTLIGVGLASSAAYSAPACKDVITADLKAVNLRGGFSATRNQTDVGWCYAYASADILTYELKRLGLVYLNDSVSASYTALLYNRLESATAAASAPVVAAANSSCPARGVETSAQTLNAFEREAGRTDKALKYLGENAICHESEIRSEIKGHHIKKFIKDFLRQYRAQSLTQDKYQEMLVAAGEIFPRVPVTAIEEVLRQRPADPLMSLAKISCDTSSSVRYPELNSRLRVVKNNPMLVAQMNSLLNHAQPFVLGHKMAMIDPNDMCRVHAMIVIGKSFNCQTGQLDFRVRNSWGVDGCMNQLVKVADPKLKKFHACMKTCVDGLACKAMCGAAITAHMANPPFRCEHGDFIFSANRIAENAYDITYYEPLGE